MKKILRTFLVAMAVALLAELAQPALPAHTAAPKQTQTYDFRFASTPDFLNADNADVSRSPYWKKGDPNSINASYNLALATVLDDLKRNIGTGSDVLVPGDLVQGHWGRDIKRTGIFGPVDTDAHRLAALKLAANIYYGQYLARFANRNLRVHAVLGDHDIGDNPWGRDSKKSYIRWKYRHVQDFKDAFARRFTASGTRYKEHPRGTSYDGTAYAFRPHPEIQVISMDVWQQTPDKVIPRVADEELAWMKRVLDKANADGVDWIIVQGHVPVVKPVRALHSSRIMYQGGAKSAFWRAMVKAGVDLYLCGEVHDTTAITPSDRGVARGPVQISHGGLFYHGEFSYLIGTLTGTSMTLQTRGFGATVSPYHGQMWETDRWWHQPNGLTYNTNSFASGSITITKDGAVLSRSGMLNHYSG